MLIGKDTRISGYMLESALEAGFASAGVDVLLSGPLPTPGVAYLTRALRLDLGVVISASHNPFADNGVKFFSAQGEKLPDEWELEVEAMLAERLGDSRRADAAMKRGFVPAAERGAFLADRVVFLPEPPAALSAAIDLEDLVAEFSVGLQQLRVAEPDLDLFFEFT